MNQRPISGTELNELKELFHFSKESIEQLITVLKSKPETAIIKIIDRENREISVVYNHHLRYSSVMISPRRLTPGKVYKVFDNYLEDFVNWLRQLLCANPTSRQLELAIA